MKLATKLLLATCATPLLIGILGFHFGRMAETSLREALVESSSKEVRALLDEIDRELSTRASNWLDYARSNLVRESLSESNAIFQELPDIPAFLDEQDAIWAGDNSDDLVERLMSNPLSQDLGSRLEMLEETTGHIVFGEVFITNAFGANVAQTGRTSDYRQDDEQWWQEAAANGIFISDVTFDESAAIYSLELCVRVDDTEGSMLGILKGVFDIREIFDIVDSHAVNSSKDSMLALLTRDGKIIRIGNTETGPLADGSALLKGVDFREKGMGEITSASSIDPESGDEMIAFCARFRAGDAGAGLGWVAMLRREANTMLAPVVRLRRSILTSSLGIGVLGLAAIGLIAIPLSRRIGKLEEATEAIAGGHLDLPVDSPANDELGRLTRSFDGMRISLREERKKLENERGLLRAMMEHLPDHIYFKDSESRFTLVSRAMATHFKLSDPSQAIGLTDRDFFAEDHAREAREDELKLMGTGVPIVGKEEMETWPDGGKSWVLTTKVPLRDREGDVVGTFGISSDITARKRAEEAMEAARDAAEDASRLKSDFLANMSHEIRTPMNGVMGMTELLLSTKLTAEQREYAKLAHQSASSLLQLINDILDFSKIEAGKLELDNHEFRLRDAVGDTLQTLGVKAAEESIELVYRIPAEVPDRLVGDLGRLRQILINLVGNAIKFTPEGEVLVDFEVLEKTEGSVHLRCSVKDTGIGVPPEKQKLIFEAFSQADTSTARRFGGTGLGLAISTELVDLMGGEMALESVEGKGSTFSFTTRFTLPAGGDRKGVPPEALSGLRVLVVDDNSTNRRVLEELLASWDMISVSREGGAPALETLVEASARDDGFTVALLDMMMPGMDGLELARQIRGSRLEPQPKLLLLSSAGRPPGSDVVDELQIDRFLSKPVKPSDLLEAIATAMGVETRPADEEEVFLAVLERPELAMDVLLAEDGRVNQVVARNLLERRGHTVTIAQNGVEAVEMSGEHPFDAILMDVQMPEMNGYEATQAIRAREAEGTGRVPIIAMTANAMEGDRVKCLEAGMDDYVAKPVRFAELYRALEAFAEGDAAGAHAPEEGEEPPRGVGFRPEEFLSSMGDNDLAAQLIVIYQEDIPPMLEDLERVLDEGDCEQLHRVSHALKGQLGNFSAEGAFAAASEFDQAAREGRLADARRMHGGLVACVAELGEELATLRRTLV